MATYESYKYSSIKWLGQIPRHWDVCRIKSLFVENNERNKDKKYKLLSFGKNSGLSYYDDIERTQSVEDLSNYRVLHSGQLLENRLQAWNGMFICSDKIGCVSPDYSVFDARNTNNICVKFYEYVFRNHIWVAHFANASMGVGSGFNRLYTNQFGSIFTIKPPIEEQEAIVAYLDKVTGEIDRAIEAQQKMIDALNERKQIIITRAVTRGVDPDAPLRDSGIDWLGKIPAHWDFCKLKYFIRIKSGDSISNTQLSDNGKYLVYGGGEPLGRYNQYNIDKGNIVIGRVGARCGCITPIYEKSWATDNALVVSCEGIDYQFLIYCLIAADLNKIASTNAQPLLTGTKVKNTYITVPNLSEQKDIVSHIERATKSIYLSVANCEHMISLLQERRQIIINEVVTGKKKVI